MGIRKLKFFSK